MFCVCHWVCDTLLLVRCDPTIVSCDPGTILAANMKALQGTLLHVLIIDLCFIVPCPPVLPKINTASSEGRHKGFHRAERGAVWKPCVCSNVHYRGNIYTRLGKFLAMLGACHVALTPGTVLLASPVSCPAPIRSTTNYYRHPFPCLGLRHAHCFRLIVACRLV